MVGLDIPVLPVQHQYIVTETHPDILARHERGLPELGVLRESDGSWYMREEAGGLLLGPYEKGAPACYLDGPDPQSEYELFNDDIDRLMPHIESAIRRVPAFAEMGIKQVYNGAIAYTPDGSPIVGPAWDKRNFWLNEGHSFGITAAAGAGWQLAEWIVEGEPTIDMLGVDPRRFGDYATGAYLKAKNEEAYANVFTIHYPDEERPAGRPLAYGAVPPARMRDLGAVFGQKFGWERPNWFAPEGVAQEDHWSFRRSRWFGPVGAECRNVRDNVGLLDMTAFAKARVSGSRSGDVPGPVRSQSPAQAGPHRTVPRAQQSGRRALRVHYPPRGGGSFLPGVGGCLPAAGSRLAAAPDADRRLCSIREPDGLRMGVLVVAGPKSRELLSRVCATDLSNASFRWLTGRDATIGLAPAKLLRLNFVGELGWEIHHGFEYQNTIFDALMDAGRDLGLKPFGIRAMDSLRVEKSYRMIGTELSIEYAALESGLDRFVRLDKDSFTGRAGLLEWHQRGFANRFVTLAVSGPEDADAIGNNPLYVGDEMVGRATSGNYGFRLEQSLALAMVRPELGEVGTALEIEILGGKYPARVVQESPWDPDNARLRA